MANSGMKVAAPVMERMGTKKHYVFPDEEVPFLWFLEREEMQAMMATVMAMAALWSSVGA
ncbi:hypothetical protein E2562_037386 [Oryza meyeriana var. granulata]|uniref:Uncharacterized protein n=1 Tax=Oryza meyeriana var. granulata TaxID=110450 RepID=A0A6G1E810_9ORYZ|nr:hypothetical protein E2562_037386 [Oryza meyeriana var. granulata]